MHIQNSLCNNYREHIQSLLTKFAEIYSPSQKGFNIKVDQNLFLRFFNIFIEFFQIIYRKKLYSKVNNITVKLFIK